MAHDKEFDLIVYGASGYTGRLVGEYLLKTYGINQEVKWAMGGRNAEKLSEVRAELGGTDELRLIYMDADRPDTLETAARRAACIITTVGPYQLYGEPLLAACAAQGTDYVDLCGEPGWMHQMIEKYETTAMESGARIVFSCGFDSIPFDLGVWFLQQEAIRRSGKPAPRIKGRVRAMNGKFSGGTAASLQATMAAVQEDPSLLAVLTNPFSLTMGFEGPAQPHGNKPVEEADLGSWSAPFIMAPINTKNVHRSNALMGHAYGEDFVYDEMMLTGPGEAGQAMAITLASTDLLGGENAPKPGEGPSREERENGNYDIMFVGTDDDGLRIIAGVKGDKDPGYGSTSKMLSESGLCLVKDGLDTPGGIYTPAPAMAAELLTRLENNAGLTFEIEA